MMKLVVLLWVMFLGSLGGVIWLGNNVPEEDDSVVQQYKIVINAQTTADAKDETVQESVNLIGETINQTENIVPIENFDKEANDGSI